MIFAGALLWLVSGAIGWGLVMARQPDREFWSFGVAPLVMGGPITLAAVITFYVFRKGDA